MVGKTIKSSQPNTEQELFNPGDSSRHTIALDFALGYFGDYTYSLQLQTFSVKIPSFFSWNDRNKFEQMNA